MKEKKRGEGTSEVRGILRINVFRCCEDASKRMSKIAVSISRIFWEGKRFVGLGPIMRIKVNLQISVSTNVSWILCVRCFAFGKCFLAPRHKVTHVITTRRIVRRTLSVEETVPCQRLKISPQCRVWMLADSRTIIAEKETRGKTFRPLQKVVWSLTCQTVGSNIST